MADCARSCRLPQSHWHQPLLLRPLLPPIAPVLASPAPVLPLQPALPFPVCQHAARHTQHHRGRTPQLPRAAAATVLAPTAAGAAPAWSQVAAVILGNVVLIGSLFRSLPQIIKVLRNGHAEGLSLTSNVVELVCFSIIIAYNLAHGYAFNTYGEVVACWLQDVIIIGLIFRHMQASPTQVLGAVGALAALCTALFWPGLLPRSVLDTAQAWNLVFLALGSRLPQVWMNYKRGNAGVLSLTTCLLNLGGNIVRTFTTLVLTQDLMLLAGCLSQGILNAIILGQVLHTRFVLKLHTGSYTPDSSPDISKEVHGSEQEGAEWAAQAAPPTMPPAGNEPVLKPA